MNCGGISQISVNVLWKPEVAHGAQSPDCMFPDRVHRAVNKLFSRRCLMRLFTFSSRLLRSLGIQQIDFLHPGTITQAIEDRRLHAQYLAKLACSQLRSLLHLFKTPDHDHRYYGTAKPTRAGNRSCSRSSRVPRAPRVHDHPTTPPRPGLLPHELAHPRDTGACRTRPEL